MAPSTEISQIRYGANNEFVLTWDSEANFKRGLGSPVAKAGIGVNPIMSCFKMYRFLSNTVKACNVGELDDIDLEATIDASINDANLNDFVYKTSSTSAPNPTT